LSAGYLYECFRRSSKLGSIGTHSSLARRIPRSWLTTYPNREHQPSGLAASVEPCVQAGAVLVELRDEYLDAVDRSSER
jgi:hypothetical protein